MWSSTIGGYTLVDGAGGWAEGLEERRRRRIRIRMMTTVRRRRRGEGGGSYDHVLSRLCGVVWCGAVRHVAEIQVHHTAILQFEARHHSHTHYEFFRSARLSQARHTSS
jgi:hypothetical protein